MKLLLTGGHTATALAVIEECLLQKQLNLELFFIGRRYATDAEKTDSLEYQEVTKLGIAFYHLSAGRINRFISLHSLKQMLKIPYGFVQAIVLIKKIRPDRILTFGGYIGLPVAFAGWLFRIPVFGHEQTLVPGLANRLAAHFLNTIFVSFPQTKQYFPQKKVMVTGNPVRKSLLAVQEVPLPIPHDIPVLYITGGTLGSHSINTIIEKILPALVEKYIVIHQTGNLVQYHDYERLLDKKNQLPEEHRARYNPVKHVGSIELGYIYQAADLIIGRSGANICFEILAVKKPALLIPLPWSSHGEQKKQAEFLKEHGVAEIFEQNQSTEQLVTLIQTMIVNRHHYQKGFQELTQYYAEDIASTIVTAVCKNHS